MNAPSCLPSVVGLEGNPFPALCIVGPLPPPSGGMANQCQELIRLLGMDGIQVEHVRSNPDYSPRWIGYIPMLRAVFRLLPYLLQLWHAAGRVKVMHVLANSGWAWHLFAAPAVWIGRMRGVAVVVNYHGGNADTFFARAPQLVFWTVRNASVLVTPSAYLQRIFARYGIDAIVVANILDLSRFNAAIARDFTDAPHLIVTRNLESIYDIPTAIRAFAAVRKVFPKARLTVAGSGPEKARLVALVGELGLSESVLFSGRIDNADIPALYASADCMLNPSTVDNMPISILEAFASGVSVVSTDAGGIPDMVEDGVSALLAPVGDPLRMGEQAIRVLTEPGLATSMRAAGLRAATSYTWPTVREQWLSVYRSVAAQQVTR